MKISQKTINVLLFAMVLSLFYLAFSNRVDIYNLKLAVQKVAEIITNPFWNIG